jgi:hypothetical protein
MGVNQLNLASLKFNTDQLTIRLNNIKLPISFFIVKSIIKRNNKYRSK